MAEHCVLGKRRPDSGPLLAAESSYLESEPGVIEDKGSGGNMVLAVGKVLGFVLIVPLPLYFSTK